MKILLKRRAVVVGGISLVLAGTGQANADSEPMEGLSRIGEVSRTVIADATGILRWQDTGEEAAFFGVNYVAPFTFTYRALGYIGADLETTIRQDLHHLRRMGMNALRVHLWEVEISDRAGNLVANEHLRLLDYLIAQCQDQRIHVLLTAINWQGNGYPEADSATEGFSAHFPKQDMGTNPAAIQASVRFLTQLVEHLNPYTRTAYKEDPTILGFELLNEPWSPPQAQLAGFFETLRSAVRDTGCQKPLFYCASQGTYPAFTRALSESRLEGVTCGWYPSGLVSRRTLTGNYLPLLDTYYLLHDPKFATKTKLIYEFDAADLDCAAIYPAFARTFRTGGAQWATQFAYCPLPLASGNTPYQTHFLNLVYAPRQAMSMVIAGEAFRQLPRGKSWGSYPENTQFGPFRVRHHPDLAEMVTEETFLYCGDTETNPPHPEALRRVSGVGSSPIVGYEGSGCYFLDKVREGVWQLEVYPDAVVVEDPHGSPRLDREAARILWREWPMSVRLPDLGDDFTMAPRNSGNKHRPTVRNATFPVRPGTYLLCRHGVDIPANLPRAEFIAPPPQNLSPTVIHVPPIELTEGQPAHLTITVAASRLPSTISLVLRQGDEGEVVRIPFHRVRGDVYSAEIPASRLRPGKLQYTVEMQDGNTITTFPSGRQGKLSPSFPLFEASRLYTAPQFAIEGGTAPIGKTEIRTVDGRKVLHLSADSLASATSIQTDFHLPIPAKRPVRISPLPPDTALRVRARATQPATNALTITLVRHSGETHTLDVPLTTGWSDFRLPLTELSPTHGYIVLRAPTPEEIASIRFALHRTGTTALDAAQGFEVERIDLGPRRDSWETIVRSRKDSGVLFDADRDHASLMTAWTRGVQGSVTLATGPHPTVPALAIEVHKVGRTPTLAARHLLDTRWDTMREYSANCNAVLVRARSPQMSRVTLQVALITVDGIPWVASVPVTPDWQERCLRLDAFRMASILRVPTPYPTGVGELQPPPTSKEKQPIPSQLESVQLSLIVSPTLRADALPVRVEIASVRLALANDPL